MKKKITSENITNYGEIRAEFFALAERDELTHCESTVVLHFPEVLLSSNPLLPAVQIDGSRLFSPTSNIDLLMAIKLCRVPISVPATEREAKVRFFGSTQKWDVGIF